MSNIISLHDKLLFNARLRAEGSAYGVVTLPLIPKGSIVKRRGSGLHNGRKTPANGVVFQPMYYKQSKQDKKFVINGPSSVDSQLESNTQLHNATRKSNNPCTINDRAYRLSSNGFKTFYKPDGRDIVTKAKFRYGPYSSHPYTNVTAYNHREVYRV